MPWGVYEDRPCKIITKTTRYTLDNETNAYITNKIDGDDLENFNLTIMRRNDPKGFAVVKAEMDKRMQKERNERTAEFFKAIGRAAAQYQEDDPEPPTKNLEVSVECPRCKGRGTELSLAGFRTNDKCFVCKGKGSVKKNVKVVK